MALGSKARKVARAAYVVAEKVQDIDGFGQRMGLLAQVYREQRAFRHLLLTHRIATDQKVAILRKVFGKALTDLEYEVLTLLLERRLILELTGIVRMIQGLAGDQGAIALTVYAAAEMDRQELADMQKRIAARIGRTVRTKMVVDAALLGGLKLRLGNRLVDATLARRLERLRETLV